VKYSADLRIYDNKFQTVDELMLKIFTDNSSTVRCTEGDDCNVHSSPVTDKQIGNQWRCHVTWWHWFSAVPTTPLYQCALSNLAACRDYWLIFRTAAHWCSLAVITQHCVLESVVGFSRGFSLWHFIKKEILCVRQKKQRQLLFIMVSSNRSETL